MATWTSRCLESEREQRNSGWSRSAHTPIKRIGEHTTNFEGWILRSWDNIDLSCRLNRLYNTAGDKRWCPYARDTISCHPLCCTNDLIDMKGRCCPKIVVSIPRSLFTSGQLRHIGGIVPKTALPLWRKVCEKKGSWHHKSLQMMNKWRITSMIVR